jgi:hypothetical protein
LPRKETEEKDLEKGTAGDSSKPLLLEDGVMMEVVD